MEDINDMVEVALDWILDYNGKLILELGAGSGEFLLRYANNKPNNYFFAIERNSRLVERFESILRIQAHKNIFIIFNKSEMLLPLIEKEKIFDEIHIYYPSVWANSAGDHIRLFDHQNCEQIIRLSKLGCQLFVKSDRYYVISDIYKQIRPIFEKSSWINPISNDFSTYIGTEIEAKYADKPQNVARFSRVIE